MPGYKRDIVMRVVPLNGAETIHWFADRLTDLGVHQRCNVTYPRSMQMREDINRVLRPVVYAKRAIVQIEVLMVSMEDQWFLEEIAEALDDTDNYSVFLSLDGGVVEREVVWGGESGISPMPISGKTVVGATYMLSLQTKEPIGPRGPMMTDPAIGMEFLPDGGMESWTSGTTMQAWTASGACTLAQETTVIAAGANSAKFTRTDGGSAAVFNPTVSLTGFRQGSWYRFRSQVRGTAAMASAVRCRVFNTTKSVGVESDGKTWSLSGDLISKASITGAFDSLDAYFRFPTTFTLTDSISPRFQGYWTGGESLYYDELSVYGPVLRPGYSTW
jgi:hypothetical protein